MRMSTLATDTGTLHYGLTASRAAQLVVDGTHCTKSDAVVAVTDAMYLGFGAVAGATVMHDLDSDTWTVLI